MALLTLVVMAVWSWTVIHPFADKDAECLWNREWARSFDSRIHSVALRKLRQLGC